MAKSPWHGKVVSVQPRIRLLRSFDERSHTYVGYVLRIMGTYGTTNGAFMIAVGKGAHAKHQFQVGMTLSGFAEAVPNPKMETAGFYKASGIKVLACTTEEEDPPPFHGVPPELPVYRERGHLRLAALTYDTKCTSCIWGCRMPVEIILDHWNPQNRTYRYETFCYGPKSCKLYKPGPQRKVPGRKGMTYTEEDWIDEDLTAHRDEED